ncbi:MAG: hemolysin family protein [Patescibacteria group bacterium]
MELIILLLLIVINGVLAMAEIAVVSSRKSRLEHAASKGDSGARKALTLANEPSIFLSTVQVGITLVGILAGAFGGATLSSRVSPFIETIPILGRYSESISFTIVVLGITYISIVFGELVPKRIALSNPEVVAASLSRFMALFSRITAPLVRLLSCSTDVVVGAMGIHQSNEDPISEDEIKVLISQATTAGVIEEAEQDIINKILMLGDKKAREIMTPQSEIFWLDSEESKTKILEKINNTTHSHYPIFSNSKEHILGFIHVKDILEHWTSKKDSKFKDYIQKPLYILETTTILNVLESFREHNTHIALVVDEYGSVEGLITVNDIFEAIVGEVPDEDEASEPHITKRDKSSWLIDGILSIDAFKHRFRIKHMWKESENDYQSVGGFIMNYLSTIPQPGDSFEWNGYVFEVVDMDGNRVDKVLLTKLPAPAKNREKSS